MDSRCFAEGVQSQRLALSWLSLGSYSRWRAYTADDRRPAIKRC
nr:MAG TPA: hypothetical protein [Caudoviricetes sp.]